MPNADWRDARATLQQGLFCLTNLTQRILTGETVEDRREAASMVCRMSETVLDAADAYALALAKEWMEHEDECQGGHDDCEAWLAAQVKDA